jgi:hypothetical protein
MRAGIRDSRFAHNRQCTHREGEGLNTLAPCMPANTGQDQILKALR